jgi:3-isopropylmalate/(R)-2-methylmalate dehydratase small subunit
MEPFQKLKSKVIPLPMKDVDTDLIIPAQCMTSVSRDGYGVNLFRRLRDSDPAFPLNDPKFAGGRILAVDDNFGCGSSREHAVWALTGGGIKAIVGKSFADIFSSNCGKNGLLLVTLEPGIVDEVLIEARSGSYEIAIDLESQTVELPGKRTVRFEYDSFRKHCLLHGHDDIDYIASEQEAIAGFRREREGSRFYSTLDLGLKA